jgi:RNA polymerase sigma-70 factor, ECF subfamily
MDDNELVRLAKDGSVDAFESLVARYQSKVFSMAMSFIRNREAADDAAQEIFLKAYLALPKFHMKSEFGTWLYRIAVNHIKDVLRKRGRAREVSLEDVKEPSVAAENTMEKAEFERSAEERKKLVHEFVQSLPEKYRTVVTLRDIQGMPYEQIAEVLHLSLGTVDSRLHRARRMLREKLAPCLSLEGGSHEM